MKTCPACEAQYDDLMSFCLQDGTPLVDANPSGTTEVETKSFDRPNHPASDRQCAVTEEFPGRPSAKDNPTAEPSSENLQTGSVETQLGKIKPEPHGTAFGILLGALLVLGLLVLGSVIGGLFWYMRGQRPIDVATVNSNRTGEIGLNAPVNPKFEGSNANLPAEVPTNTNSVVSTKLVPTQKPDEIPEPEATAAETPEENIDATPTQKPTAKPTRVRTVSGGVVNGKATSLPKPAYPPAARAVGASGSVNVKVLIDENGNVVRANAVSGHPLLRNSAERAARSAKFPPPELGLQPVKISGVIVYVFQKN